MTVVIEDDFVRTLYGIVAEPQDIHHELCKFKVDDADPLVIEPDPRPNAAQIGPVTTPANTWANRDSCAAKAVFTRYLTNHVPFKMNKKERNKVRTAVNEIIREHFARDIVTEEFLNHPVLLELKSPKMTEATLEKTIDDLLDSSGALPEYKYMVKNEVLKLGKNPRLIINAGNMHQLAALLVISIFEKLWFNKDAKDHIKNACKYEAMQRVVTHLDASTDTRPRNTKCGPSRPVAKVGLEGDGSSWDFCCSKELRKLIERPILNHILDCILESGVFHEIPYQAMRESIDFASKDWWIMQQSTIDWKIGHKRRLHMNVVRASGERGTSCLNHLVNIVLWTCCLLDTPSEIFKRKDRGASTSGWHLLSRRFTGRERKWFSFRAAFEGDDSLLRICQWVLDEYRVQIIDYWTKAGHRMKLVGSSDVHKDGPLQGRERGYCTFVGYDIMFEESKFTNIMFPTIDRNLASQSFTTSYYACQEGKDRYLRVKEVGVQAHASRAIAYLPHFPELAQFFIAMMQQCQKELVEGGRELKKSTTVTEQMHFKLGLPLGESVDLNELLCEAEMLFVDEDRPKYEELVFRTTGHRLTTQDRTSMTMLTNIGLDDTDEVLDAIPSRFFEPCHVAPRKLPDEFLRVINKDEIGLA